MLPPVGASMPAMRLNSVLLPQPDGPTIETKSPASTLQRDVSQRLDRQPAAEGLAYAVDLQRGRLRPSLLTARSSSSLREGAAFELGRLVLTTWCLASVTTLWAISHFV